MDLVSEEMNGGVAQESITLKSNTESDKIYELVIHNLPKYKNNKELKKYLNSLGLEPRRVQVHRDHAYVLFGDESSLTAAIPLVHNKPWKGSTLRAKRSASRPSTMANSSGCKVGGVANETGDQSATATPIDPTSCGDWEALMRQATEPLAAIDYSEQLRRKQDESYKLLKKISWEIRKVCDVKPALGNYHYGSLDAIHASPVTVGYRNKCEFTIGRPAPEKDQIDNNDKDRLEVGFALNRYRDLGRTVVVPVDQCKIVPDLVKQAVKRFCDQVLTKSNYSPCDGITGFWRSLTAKFFKMDLMLIVTVSTNELSAEKLNEVKGHIVQAFFDTVHRTSLTPWHVTSLFLASMQFQSDTPKYEKLAGCPYVYETVLNNRFRISPSTFFQTNTSGCNVLYNLIVQYLKQLKEDYVKTRSNEEKSDDVKILLLDLCCGCGSIAISLADHVKLAIGIEIIEEAVEDAKINALCNEKSNCQFVAGKAEETFVDMQREKLIDFDQYDIVVAVLDPPRKGLGDKIIGAIRQCSPITNLVYVSCDPRGAMKNFVDLCRRPSKRYGGLSFELKRTAPVDLFPQTNHFEWIMFYERDRLSV